MKFCVISCEEGRDFMKQFLLIQLARFGDLVQTGRLLYSLERYGQVHLCIDKSLEGLAACLYPKAIVHTVPAHSSGKDTQSVLHVHQTLEALRQIDFCAVYNVNYSPLNTAIVRLFSPEIVHGYAVEHGQLVRSPWVHKAFLWTKNRQISPVNLVDFWAHFAKNPVAPHVVNPPAKGQGRGIGVVLAGRESRRSLPPPVLAQVVRTVFESLGGPAVYVLGSAAELPLARQLKRLLPTSMQDKIVDYCGKTSWQGLMDALQGLDVLISPDTGTMHLGARLGVPVQAFFLSSAWCHETGPYGEGHTVWQAVHTCTPCLESSPCHIATKCLQDFSHRNFYRALTACVQNISLPQVEGKELPATLTCQKSFVDALGAYWKTIAGKDVYAAQRQALRAVVAEYCHCPLEGEALDAQTVQFFYEEADWMLRDTRPCFTALMKEI